MRAALRSAATAQIAQPPTSGARLPGRRHSTARERLTLRGRSPRRAGRAPFSLVPWHGVHADAREQYPRSVAGKSESAIPPCSAHSGFRSISNAWSGLDRPGRDEGPAAWRAPPAFIRTPEAAPLYADSPSSLLSRDADLSSLARQRAASDFFSVGGQS